MCISASHSMNMFASINLENDIFINSLSSGMFLNKITLCPAVCRVYSIWLNKNAYVTLSGTIRLKNNGEMVDRRFIQSIGINGDFVGKPCYINANIFKIDQDRAYIHNCGLHINLLSGNIENWSNEEYEFHPNLLQPMYARNHM